MNATFNRSNTLLHDVILMEARAYALKFMARKRKADSRMKNVLKQNFENIQDSVDKHDTEELRDFKQCLDDLERKV